MASERDPELRIGERFNPDTGDIEELAEIANQPTLKEKLLNVALHCAYIRKDGVNQFHKYNYATAAQIFEKVGEALAEQRLISRPLFFIATDKDRTNAKGGTENLVTMEVKLTVQDVDTGDMIQFNAYGSGQDNGDKAIMKAQTAALKYAWMMLLNISTGDDPEADATVDSRASGEPIQKKKTPEEYQATVERNKRATMSPEAIRLSEQLKRELATEGVVESEDGWSMEGGDELKEETCKCGSLLVEKKTGPKAKKPNAPYLTCDLADRAFRKDQSAMDIMARVAANGLCGEKEHTWRWVG